MKTLLMTAALLVSSFAFASELDQDMTNQGLTGTVVMRVDSRTNAVSMLKTDAIVTSEIQAQALAKTGAFETAPMKNVRTELDQEAGASSWYWYCGYNYPSYLYWYGYNYYPVYTYYYSSYTYYYYSWYRW